MHRRLESNSDSKTLAHKHGRPLGRLRRVVLANIYGLGALFALVGA